MKSHYVPKMYLKGWQTVHEKREGQICVYEKRGKPAFKSIRRQVGFLPDYYTEEAEEWIAREIENKTAPLFAKMREETALTTAEKIQFSRFIFVLWFRVPYSINGFYKEIREKITIEDTLKGTDTDLWLKNLTPEIWRRLPIG